MKIYTFWQSDAPMPKYLQLCINSWGKNIDNLDLIVINHRNWDDFCGDFYDLEKLKNFSFAMQSDAVSACVLATKGGLFMDADTIVTKDISKTLANIAPSKFVGFGQPNSKGFHVAVIKNDNPSNPVAQAWFSEVKKRIENKPSTITWAYMANEPLSQIFKNEKYYSDYLILDRSDFGNVQESIYLKGDPIFCYLNFWFNEKLNFNVGDVISENHLGVISLHNSWTPKDYKLKSDISEFYNENLLLSKVLLSVNGFDPCNKNIQK